MAGTISWGILAIGLLLMLCVGLLAGAILGARGPSTALDLLDCPECGLPAERLGTRSSPIIRCVFGHRVKLSGRR